MLAGCNRNTCMPHATHAHMLAPRKDSQKRGFCACTISGNSRTLTFNLYHLAHIHSFVILTPLPNQTS